VRGDFKANRVKDPTAPISSKHEKTVKNFVKDFMDKAVKKRTERENDKGARSSGDITMSAETATPETPRFGVESRDAVMTGEMPGYNAASPRESSGTELKRKREEDGEAASPKKYRTDLQPVPPPPPPPTEDMPVNGEGSTLTPMDDDPISVHSASDGSVNGARPKILDSLASPMQLATPPSKEHNGYHQHSVPTVSKS
jgi:hypothetical protein